MLTVRQTLPVSQLNGLPYQALNGEYIGLEEVHDGVWNLIYYDTLLGRFDERTNAITGAPSTRRGC